MRGGELNAAVTSAVVERLTERRVVALVSGNNIDPDMAAQVFILDGPPSAA